MKKILTLILSCNLLMSFAIAETVKKKKKKADSRIRSRIFKENWDGLPLVWLKDERFPTYRITIYFADGGLSDHPTRAGETELMFHQLSSGTNRFGQKEISDNLEFFGVSHGASVTHEYSTYSFSGLVKDIIPTAKKICHLFNDATFPQNELTKTKRRIRNGLRSLVTSPSALANRSFRMLSLKHSGVANPTGGTLKSISRIKRSHLRKKKEYFNKKVKKRIYISGPESAKVVKNIFIKECDWDIAKADYVRSIASNAKLNLNPKIYLITVPKANQAQIRIGRILKSDEGKERELISVSSGYLGGGFTSKLMTELRVKRGLTYSARAIAGFQKDYGRAFISTFTKDQTVGETVNVIKQVLSNINENIPQVELDKTLGLLAGGHPFRFEESAAFLSNLVFNDHVGMDYDSIYEYPEIVMKTTTDQVSSKLKSIYDWDQQTIVVVGNKKLKKQLTKFGRVYVIDYKKFL